MLWTETLQSLRKGWGKTLSFMKSQKWRQYVTEQIPFLFEAFLKLTEQDCTPPVCLGFLLERNFVKEWANMYYCPWERSVKCMCPQDELQRQLCYKRQCKFQWYMYSRWGIILTPAVPWVRDVTHAVMNSVIFIYFIATFHNVKYRGPSLLTFPAQTAIVPYKSTAQKHVEKFNPTVM